MELVQVPWREGVPTHAYIRAWWGANRHIVAASPMQKPCGHVCDCECPERESDPKE